MATQIGSPRACFSYYLSCVNTHGEAGNRHVFEFDLPKTTEFHDMMVELDALLEDHFEMYPSDFVKPDPHELTDRRLGEKSFSYLSLILCFFKRQLKLVRNTLLNLIFICSLTQGMVAQELALPLKAIPVFARGQEGYDCYRIPAVIKLTNGDLLAFAEARKNGCSDTGDIDLVMKRSKNDGRNWGRQKIIWDDGENTCGNPAPIVDLQTGDIFLLSTWNLGSDHEKEIIAQTSTDTRRIFIMKSADQGESFSTPREITEDVKAGDWTWYATGPGSGIQLKAGPDEGRLIVACDHIEAETRKYYSHIIYSDDQGTTWKLGGSSPKDQVNECEVAELDDGRLMLNMRNYDRDVKRRQVAFSSDGGLTWEAQHHDSTLVEPICQASLHRHHVYLLFSNPASEDSRTNMTLRLSSDDGAIWSKSLVLHKGPAAYSDLVSLSENLVGCLFEAGVKNPYRQILFQQIEIRK